jgi:hypothetical protein
MVVLCRCLAITFFAFTIFTAICSDLAVSHEPNGPRESLILQRGMGSLDYPISVTRSLTKRYFDEGLKLIYAFNFDEATRSFQHGGWRTLSHAFDLKLLLGAAPFERAKRKGAVLELFFF